MRATRSHSANRRSHHALKSMRLSVCKNCGVTKLPHAICANCGQYGDKKVIDVAARLAKKAKKDKEKEKAAVK